MSVAPAIATARRPARRSAALRLWRFPRLMVGAGLLALLVAGAVLAPILTRSGPTAADYSALFQPPSPAHLLGTDELGRDLWSRLLYGGQQTLAVAVATIAVSAVVGVALGLLSGFRPGPVDGVIMRTIDVLLAFPALVLALTITFALGPSFATVLIALSVVSVPRFARLVRGEVLALGTRTFVDASRVAGASAARIMLRHLLPNAVEVILVQAALTGGDAIFTSASLSFLGLGLPPPAPNWGGMLKEGYAYLAKYPLQAIVPGTVIFVAMLSFNLIGDGLRDWFDPRTRRGRRTGAEEAA